MTRTPERPSGAGHRRGGARRRVTRRSRLLLALLAAAAPAALARAAHASCGLDVCPLDRPQPDTAVTPQVGVHVPTLFRVSKFSLDGDEGHYVETLIRSEYRGLPGWVFAAALPVVHLMVEHEDDHTGLGNAVLMVEWERAPSAMWSLAAGTQLELPVGDAEHGIASDHTEVLPYGRASLAHAVLRVSASVGVRLAVEGDEPEAAVEAHGVGILHTPAPSGQPLYVNPHEGRELVYRGLAEYALLEQRVRPGLLVRGEHVLEPEATTRAHVHGGAQVSASVTRNLEIVLLGELPLTRPARIDWRTGLGITWRL
jgi:hypothetical protein